MQNNLSKWYRYLAPRITVLVVTSSKAGVTNAAPFSFVIPVSADPPLIAIASAPGHHTLKNIRETGEFTVNIPGGGIMDKIWLCSRKFGENVSELEESGLETFEFEGFGVPGVSDCFCSYACRLTDETAQGDHILIIGKVKDFRIDEGLIDDSGGFLVERAKPLMHLGGQDFIMPGQRLKAEG